MSIQDSVNKALGIGAVLATQSPLMENQKIKAAKKSEVKRLNAQAGLLEDKATADYDPDNFFEKAAPEEARRQLKEVNRRLFELNPTNKTASDYYGTFTLGELKQTVDELKRRDDANINAEIKRYSKKAQNQAFKVLKESKKNGKT